MIIKIDSDKSMLLQNRHNSFGVALDRESAGVTQDSWVDRIGKQDTQVLPSGNTLLTGAAAEEKIKTIVDNAWTPPPEQRRKAHGARIYGTPVDRTSDLDKYLYAERRTTKDDLQKYGKTIRLGVYNNIILTTTEAEAPTAADRQRLLSETVQSLEYGARYEKELPILSKIKAQYYPLVLELNNGATKFEMVSAETSIDFRANFDTVYYSPRSAMKTKSGKIISPWVGLFHEWAHVINYDMGRYDSMNTGANNLSHANFFYSRDEKIPRDMAMEDFATDYEQKLCALAYDDLRDFLEPDNFTCLPKPPQFEPNENARNNYDDFDGEILVDGPFSRKPL